MNVELDVQLLHRIHHLLRQKADLKERLDKGPRLIAATENNVRKYMVKLDEIKESIKSTTMKADDKQLQLAEREAHIDKLTKQRNSCDSNREYQLLSEQIAADQQANSVLEDEILELLEKIERLEGEQAKAGEDLKKLEADAEKVKRETNSRLDSLNHDLDIVENELKESEQQLPLDIRTQYQRLTAAMGEDALAIVEDKTCGHCMKIISVQTLSELTKCRPVFCGGCGSLMYLPKTAAAT